MKMHATQRVNVYVPTGALGVGIKEEDVAAALRSGIDAIACDAGSTDSGPAYLATAQCKYARSAIKEELRILMRAQAVAKVPLLIGSCGTSGADAALDWTLDIAAEVAHEEGLRPRMAALYSEQSPQRMAQLARQGRIRPLEPVVDASPDAFEACDHIVALMGPEPYMAAIDDGADIVFGGRTSDPAVIAALPLMRGAGAGPAWHAGKTAECGALCTTHPRVGGVVVRVGRDDFLVEPVASTNACTPASVSRHMLYENKDPCRLYEPGGVLDVTQSRYEAVGERVVRVAGSRFDPMPYTMKLEGAAAVGFQTIMLVGIQSPEVLADVDGFLQKMQATLVERTARVLGLAADAFDISLRPYGWNAVCGAALAPDTPRPRELGLLFVATAADQATANQIAKTCNPWFFHLPVNEDQDLPSYAFPFSPAEVPRGAVYAFKLNHVVDVADGHELVRRTFPGTL
jgi:hypothetical protein